MTNRDDVGRRALADRMCETPCQSQIEAASELQAKRIKSFRLFDSPKYHQQLRTRLDVPRPPFSNEEMTPRVTVVLSLANDHRVARTCRRRLALKKKGD